jgi:hypothetical protein
MSIYPPEPFPHLDVRIYLTDRPLPARAGLAGDPLPGQDVDRERRSPGYSPPSTGAHTWLHRHLVTCRYFRRHGFCAILCAARTSQTKIIWAYAQPLDPQYYDMNSQAQRDRPVYRLYASMIAGILPRRLCSHMGFPL